MHDGRSTTLAEAILEHALSSTDTSSEARASRAAYLNRTQADKQAVIAFLENLVLFKLEEEEVAAAFSLLTTPTTQQVVRIAPKGFRIVLPQ
jgi:hypothetical protein